MRSNLLSILVFVFLAIPGQLLASPQVPDYIIFGKDTIATYNLILEAYLQDHETIESNKLFGLTFREGASTSCWRGYQALYKVENDSIYLVGILNCGDLRTGNIDRVASRNKMNAIFGNSVTNDRVWINWFSGDISFPLNNKLVRWDGVFYSTYEKESIIHLESGKVLGVESVNNYVDDPKGIDRWEKSKVSSILFKKLKKAKWPSSDDCDCSEKYSITIDSSGKVSKVVMLGYNSDEEIDRVVGRTEYNFCLTTIYKTLQSLRFDVIKDRGKAIAEDIYLEIWVTEKGKLENWTY